MSLQFGKQDGSILLIISTLVLQLFLFGPMQVLLNNFGEMTVRFVDVLQWYVLVSIVLILLLWIVVRLLKVSVLPAVLTFVSAVAFIESRFFLSFAHHQPFDGKLIDWQSIQDLSHVELGAIAALGLLFALLHKQLKLLTAVSLFILIFVSGGFFFLLSLNTDVMRDTRQVETTETKYFNQFYRLSDQSNVIHIVPDQTQGAMVHEIIKSDPERYAEIFEGFTLFTQAMGRYQSTYPSVLYYMAGEAPEPELDLTLKQPFSRDYIAQTLQEKSIVRLLADSGYKAFGFQFHPGIFCKGPYTACTGTHDEVFAGVPVNNPDRRFRQTLLTLLDVALFQASPVILRKQIFNDGNWFVRNLENNRVSHSGILEVFTQRVGVFDGPGSYNYFHHAGAHAPILFDQHCGFIGLQEITWESQQEQVKCSLRQIEKLIEALKRKNIYDQTLIVINGDHGTPWLPPGYVTRMGSRIPETLVGTASTLMLIKPPSSHGPLRFSSQPVSLGDIPATIAAELGIDHAYDGIEVFENVRRVERERHFFTYDEAARAHNLQALTNLARYRVRGDLFDESSWQPPNAETSLNTMSLLRMDDPEFSQYAKGFSDLEQQARPVRWVDGKRARVVLEPPGQVPLALVFECYVPPGISGQSMNISIGGKLIGSLDEQQLQEHRHIIPIPDDIPREDWMEIQFDMGKSEQIGQDTRSLSVLFWYIGLEPVESA